MRSHFSSEINRADFTEVEQLSRAQEFADNFIGQTFIQRDVLCMNPPGTTRVFMLDDDPGRWYWHLSPDGTSYYILKENNLVEYDAGGNITKKLSATDLGLDLEKYAFGKIIAVSGNRIWLTLNHWVPGEKGASSNRDTVLEILLHDIDNSAVFHELGFYKCIAIDTNKEDMYIVRTYPKFCVDIYDLKSKTYVTKLENCNGAYVRNITWVDYCDTKGLLLSLWYYNKKSKVFHMDLNTGGFSEIAKGVNAWWGSDGYAYYLRGHTQLWRNKLNGEPELVCGLTKKPKGRNGYIQALWFSNDSSFGIFSYQVPLSGKRFTDGRVYFDVESKEYLHVSGGTIGQD